MSKLKNIDTHGKITETYYEYAHEKGNQQLIDANIVDTSLETAVLEKQDIGGTGKIISQIETKYGNPTNIYPSSIVSYDLKTPSVSSTEITYDLYDAKGNLQQYTTKNGVSMVLIWGYNGTKLIAKVEGAKLTDIQHSKIDSIVNASDIDALAPANNDETSFLTVLSSFRASLPGFQVATYTCDPQIGVRSVTHPQEYEKTICMIQQAGLKRNGSLF
ncbi:hypothetical protein [Chryseobacterium sp. S90]|uniref:hypothetical protein n=1 Tax=Chryseobacterium sp. S90 TaxID=3395373 RepID=UPI0039BC5BF0